MTVPILYSTNDAFAKCTSVSICSLIENADKTATYDIRVIYTDLTDDHIKLLCSLSNSYATVRTIDITDWVESIDFDNKYTENCFIQNREIFYRLYLSELKDIDRVVSIDGDTVVLGDIKELYDTDLQGNVLAATKNQDESREIKEHLPKCNLSIEKYFNSGVLVVDLKQYRDLKVTEKSLRLFDVPNPYRFPDQDALNILLENKVHYIDSTWNRTCISFFEQLKKTKTVPKIVHYAGKYKPWTFLDVQHGEYFWKYAKKLNFTEDDLCTEPRTYLAKYFFNEFLFPYKKIEKDSSVILYAGGDVGYAFRKQLEFTDYCNVVMHCDKNYADPVLKCNIDYVISPPEDILTATYDTVLICAYELHICKAIEKDLIAMGVPAEKITFDSYAMR